MAQGNIVELAKKGDASAIATLMNKSLRPKGVAAQAVRTGNFLEITLHSQRALNQKAMLEIVQKGMKNLQVAAIERVLVRSQTGDTPTWESEFVLNENISPSPPPQPETTPQNPTLSDSVQAVQKLPAPVSSAQPSGMVLLPKLSQVNRSLQQYQDIIVRLTDDAGSQIICLCTLAELIQSLHMPNPQLQHIVEAIAKCSSVNADGEKIIRNVSILQPGQAWQKTQIRCVLQVFFEMGTPSIPAPETPCNETVIETTEVIPSAEETEIEAHRGTSAEETVIETVSRNKARELEALHENTGIQTREASTPAEATGRPNEETVIEAGSPSQAKEPEKAEDSSSEALFREFTFTMMAPVQNVTDIDTLSNSTAVSPAETPFNLTLEEFRRDLLAMAG